MSDEPVAKTDRGRRSAGLAVRLWNHAAGGKGRQPASDDEAIAIAAEQLEAIRKRAEGWRSGVAATFTLILATLAIKPGEGFMKYEGWLEKALGALIGASVLISLAGLLLLIRAANGPSWLQVLSSAEKTEERYLSRARGAYLDFVLGRAAWALALALFLAAVVLTWLHDPPA